MTLYQGGEYWLYRYKKYTDVRLVFAPEQQIAFFGGDPDNFTYPRYDLDMALFRVYENGKPIESKDFLRWNPKGAADNELVFVSGHPGSTQRLDTVAQLTMERDVTEPAILKVYKHRLDVLAKYAAQGPEQARQVEERSRRLENSRKAFEGRLEGLLDVKVMAKKQQEENEFQKMVMANPQWKAAYGGAWKAIAEAESKAASREKETFFHGLDSALADFGRIIVQYVAEVKKPDGERLEGYHESQLESLQFQLSSRAPIYKAMEIARITGALEQDLAEVGPDDPFIKIVLNGKTPKEAATELVNGTKLDDPAVRKKLMDGGEAAVAASDDSMIVLARKLDPMRRELIKWTEDNVQSVLQRAGEQLGKARFAAYGKTTYPDATFTLRLSYGQVKGYPMNGTKAPYKTTFYGLYDRATSFDYDGPFDLPSRYKEGRSKLDLATPVNFVTSNDVIGGNSGSPVINRNAEIVGLIFDGNIESLVGDFVYNPEKNRSVAVHTAAMTEALRKLYGAQALVNELMPRSETELIPLKANHHGNHQVSTGRRPHSARLVQHRSRSAQAAGAGAASGHAQAHRAGRSGAAVSDEHDPAGSEQRAARSKFPKKCGKSTRSGGRRRCFARGGWRRRSIRRRAFTTSTKASARPARTSRTPPSRRPTTTRRKAPSGW